MSIRGTENLFRNASSANSREHAHLLESERCLGFSGSSFKGNLVRGGHRKVCGDGIRQSGDHKMVDVGWQFSGYLGWRGHRYLISR